MHLAQRFRRVLVILIIFTIQHVYSMEDYMLTCSRPVKKSRSFFVKEPCQFGKGESWCNLPGDGYPWHAVRRFVFENQGLMRRMYGEVRQLSLLRMEFSEDFDNTIEHEGRSNEDEEPQPQIEQMLNVSNSTEMKSSNVSKEESVTEEQLEQTTVLLDFEDTTATTTATTGSVESVEFSDELRLDDGHVLFQDIEKKNMGAKNKMSGTLKAVNACPVKEEVVAPYWANNTRGEILALLNLYPFEQYVHWEKCSYENKQMRCRDGCRCEQQYRLHRLLAFDPSNECRGIFSDWFRFPSCCVCRCYLTSAEEFQERVKFNRSPRKLQIIDGPDVNGVDDSHFFYRSLNVQPR